MKKMINRTHIEGYIYDVNKLEMKVTGAGSKNPGTEFISGEIQIATDDACLNIVPVHFTYVTAKTAKKADNATFAVLKNVIDGITKTVMSAGKDNAAKVRIDSAIGLNDFYTDRDGEVVAVAAKRNEGGFIHLVDVLAEDEKTRNTFEADMLITGVTHVDAVEEKNLPEKVVVKGAVFDFRNSLLPVEFSATNAGAMSYFEGLGASAKEPVFTKVWGRQISETVVKRIEEESAFGDASVREVRNSRKDWVITGAAKDPYVWDDETTITAAELSKAVADRETYLAGVKQRYDEYQASKKGSTGATTAAGGFNF